MQRQKRAYTERQADPIEGLFTWIECILSAEKLREIAIKSVLVRRYHMKYNHIFLFMFHFTQPLSRLLQ